MITGNCSILAKPKLSGQMGGICKSPRGCASETVCALVSTVSEADHKRLREAAKRLGNASGTISQHTFLHDVLGANVPAAQAEVCDQDSVRLSVCGLDWGRLDTPRGWCAGCRISEPNSINSQKTAMQGSATMVFAVANECSRFCRIGVC